MRDIKQRHISLNKAISSLRDRLSAHIDALAEINNGAFEDGCEPLLNLAETNTLVMLRLLDIMDSHYDHMNKIIKNREPEKMQAIMAMKSIDLILIHATVIKEKKKTA